MNGQQFHLSEGPKAQSDRLVVLLVVPDGPSPALFQSLHQNDKFDHNRAESGKSNETGTTGADPGGAWAKSNRMKWMDDGKWQTKIGLMDFW